MNKFILSLIFIIFRCTIPALAQKTNDKIVEVYQEKFFLSQIQTSAFSTPNSYPAGSYYGFIGITRNGITDIGGTKNPELLIGFLIGQGIDVEEAWYRGSLTRCDLADVMVPSSLTIRVRNNKQEELLKKFGFRKVDKPTSGGCSNSNLAHYDFRIQNKK